MNLMVTHVGRQVSPIPFKLFCQHGMFGTIIEVGFNQALVEWADGHRSWEYQSDLELVRAPASAVASGEDTK